MRVKNLPSWAGDDFSYAPGQIIDLDDVTAQARINAGLAEAVEEAPADPPTPETEPEAPAAPKPKRGRPRKRAGVAVETASIETPETR